MLWYRPVVLDERSSQPLAFRPAMASLIVVRFPQRDTVAGCTLARCGPVSAAQTGQGSLRLTLRSSEPDVAVTDTAVYQHFCVGRRGLEPRTLGLKVPCSA